MSNTFPDASVKRSLIRDMVANQANLNATAYSDTWLAKAQSGEWNYRVAASQEVAEFINSYWLPWWSKAEQDLVNCRIEIVDALHFMLSDMLALVNGDVDRSVSYIELALQDHYDSFELFETGEGDRPLEYARMLQQELQTDDSVNDFECLFRLAESIGFGFDQMFALYMGKSTLNKFRQDHGYKQGTYKKKWDGVHEDNYFLASWVAEQETAPTVEQIREWLDAAYASHNEA